MRRSTDGGWLFTRDRAGAGPRATPLARRSEQPRELAPEPAGELRHLARDHLPRLAKRLVDGGEDEVFEHLGIVGRDDLSVDLDGQDLLIAVGLDHDHPPAGRRLHLPLGDLHLQGLHLGLELLRLLHEVAESLHGPSSAPRRGARGPAAPGGPPPRPGATAGWRRAAPRRGAHLRRPAPRCPPPARGGRPAPPDCASPRSAPPDRGRPRRSGARRRAPTPTAGAPAAAPGQVRPGAGRPPRPARQGGRSAGAPPPRPGIREVPRRPGAGSPLPPAGPGWPRSPPARDG